jgi:aryl-alcohol dehydrogenase-like predicted oxidoreductase
METNFEAQVSRRDFIRVTMATSLLMAAGQAALGQQDKRGNMLYRPLGRTGVKVSVLGLGGSHIGRPEESEGIRITRAAIDGGLTFMDNSWDYGNGASEERMGKALKDGYRDKAFLMTKIDGRTKSSAAKQIGESLSRLQTDHVDLMQFHEVIRMEDADRIFAEGGAMEAMQEAKKAGKVRFIGFTGHKDPLVHLRMLEVAQQHGFVFDTVQMPLNVMDAHFRSFQHQVVPELVKQGIGVLGMKSMGSGEILKSGVVKATECLQYALSLPVSVVITGIESMKDLNQAFEVARAFKPLTQDLVAELLAKTSPHAKAGKYELFKTGTRYDATAHHPEFLG